MVNEYLLLEVVFFISAAREGWFCKIVMIFFDNMIVVIFEDGLGIYVKY